MRALSVLSLKDNRLCNKEAGKALSEMLAGNTVLKELDVSSNRYRKCDSAGFAQELVVGLGDNGAMTKLDARYNGINIEGKDALRQAAGSRYMLLKDSYHFITITSARTGSNFYYSNSVELTPPPSHRRATHKICARQHRTHGRNVSGVAEAPVVLVVAAVDLVAAVRQGSTTAGPAALSPEGTED
jgi:hypothetical protein